MNKTAGQEFGIYWDDSFFGAYWMDSFGHWSKAVEDLPGPKMRIHNTEFQYQPSLDGQSAEVRFPHNAGHDTFAIAAHEQVLYFTRVSNPAVVNSERFQALPAAREGLHFRFGLAPRTAASPVMGFDEYQREAMRTASSKHPSPYDLANFGLGAIGEAGEIAEMVKKHVYHGHKMDTAALSKEIGDVAWYLAVIADRFGLSLQDIAEQNIAKLRARYPDGFSEEASQERIEYVTGIQAEAKQN